MLSLSINRRYIQYEISNPAKEPVKNKIERESTGLENLKKRMELIYPDKHKMETKFENGIYKAMLEISLTA
jgi:LytS/YehU family sensor histidine kinase